MDYTRLGRTGLKISRLALGTMNFGPHATEAESFAIMDRALELGLNLFDTADVYGWKRGEGITEQILGRWLAQGGGRRERIVLATKVYGAMGDGPNDRGLSAYHIARAVEGSLQRLQTDCIDLYQMHHIDREVPWDELWEAMARLVQAGKLRYVGASNLAGWHLAQAQEAALARRLLGLVSEQSLYNLVTRSVELEVIPACQAYGLGLLPWSPLARGLLGGILDVPSTGRRADANTLKRLEAKRPQVEAYEAFCRELGEPPARVALAWLRCQPAVTAPIIGPRTLAQLDEAVASLDVTLDQAALTRLDEIWPGPGGPAPEAYAW